MFGRKKKNDQAVAESGPQGGYTDSAQIEENASAIGKGFIKALDRAVRLQSGLIEAYVDRLRRANPEATPQQIQEMMDKHFHTIAAGSGAGAGGAAAIPGIGFVTGTAAIAGESLLFVDLAAVYTVGSAYLRGADISDEEHRKAIVLMVLLGTQGTAIVDTLIGPEAARMPGPKMLKNFTGPTLNQANSMMTRALRKSISKRLRRMWIGKLMPFGIGAVAGLYANRKLAKAVVDNVSNNLGQPPAQFLQELPPKTEVEEELDKAESDKNSRLAAMISVFRKNRDNGPEIEGDPDAKGILEKLGITGSADELEENALRSRFSRGTKGESV